MREMSRCCCNKLVSFTRLSAERKKESSPKYSSDFSSTLWLDRCDPSSLLPGSGSEPLPLAGARRTLPSTFPDTSGCVLLSEVLLEVVLLCVDRWISLLCTCTQLLLLFHIVLGFAQDCAAAGAQRSRSRIQAAE